LVKHTGSLHLLSLIGVKGCGFLTNNNIKCMDKWKKEYNKMAELNEFFGLPYDEHTDELIESFIRTTRQNDKEELIKIADAGEYEDLRREVNNYYK